MPPFNNRDIVQAVNYAIDRKTLLSTIWDNIGKVSYQAFPRGYVGYSEAAANLYPYNPAKAKALVAASGLSTPVAFPITYFDYGPYKALAEALQSELERGRLQHHARRPAARPGRDGRVREPQRRLQSERHLRSRVAAADAARSSTRRTAC